MKLSETVRDLKIDDLASTLGETILRYDTSDIFASRGPTVTLTMHDEVPSNADDHEVSYLGYERLVIPFDAEHWRFQRDIYGGLVASNKKAIAFAKSESEDPVRVTWIGYTFGDGSFGIRCVDDLNVTMVRGSSFSIEP